MIIFIVCHKHGSSRHTQNNCSVTPLQVVKRPSPKKVKKLSALFSRNFSRLRPQFRVTRSCQTMKKKWSKMMTLHMSLTPKRSKQMMVMTLVLTTLMIVYTSKLSEPSITTTRHCVVIAMKSTVATKYKYFESKPTSNSLYY